MFFYLKALFMYSSSSWRKTDQGGDIEWTTKSQQSLMTECKTKPIFGQDEDVRILFAGFSGHGKTTSISNFLSIFSGNVTYVGGCYNVRGLNKDEISGNVRNNLFGTRATLNFKEFPVNISGEPAYFSFADSPGLAQDKDVEETTERLKEYIADSPSIDKTKRSVQPCSLVFVIDANIVYRLSVPFKKAIIKLLHHAQEKDVAVEVLLTKCDDVDTSLRNPSFIPYIFRSSIIEDRVKQAARVFSNIPLNRIHPVVNNTTDTTLITERTILHLLAMRSILTNAKAVLASRNTKRIKVEYVRLNDTQDES